MDAPFVYGRIADDPNFTDRENVIEIQDPAFEYWLKNCYQNPVKRSSI